MTQPNTRNSVLEASFHGIPCQAEVVCWKPQPAIREGGLLMEPPEEGGHEVIALYDRRGHRAKWLENKGDLNDADIRWPANDPYHD